MCGGGDDFLQMLEQAREDDEVGTDETEGDFGDGPHGGLGVGVGVVLGVAEVVVEDDAADGGDAGSVVFMDQYDFKSVWMANGGTGSGFSNETLGRKKGKQLTSHQYQKRWKCQSSAAGTFAGSRPGRGARSTWQCRR